MQNEMLNGQRALANTVAVLMLVRRPMMIGWNAMLMIVIICVRIMIGDSRQTHITTVRGVAMMVAGWQALQRTQGHGGGY